MKRLAFLGPMLAVILAVTFFSSAAMALVYDWCGKRVDVEGFIRQEFAFGVQHTTDERTNQSGLHSAYQIWYLDTNVSWTDNFETRAILRMWGDLAYAMLDNNDRWKENGFASARNNLQWDDNFNQILREFYVTYSSTNFMVRAGKQQIGWGEADGMRLMDIINPLDGRRGPFYDTEGYEEVRIPKWMIKADYFPPNFSVFYDLDLELIWNPGDVQETGELLPPFGRAHTFDGRLVPGAWPTDCQKQWGIWGIPVNFVPLPVRLNKKERSTALKNSEGGVRFKFSFANTSMTLNYWQGFNADSILQFRGVLPDFQNGFIFPDPTAGFPPFPAYINMDRIYKRARYIGFTLNRELYGVGDAVRQVANPVLRIEALYQPELYLNTGEMTATTMLKIRKIDQIRYMVGFDWPMRITWINPSKNVFFSGQMFHIITLNRRDGVQAPRPAPFYTWTWPKNQFVTSLMVRTEYFNENVVPAYLVVWDHHSQSAWSKTKCTFKFGDHWRPEIGWIWIKKNSNHTQYAMGPMAPPTADNWRFFGTFEDRDEVYLRIQYQF